MYPITYNFKKIALSNKVTATNASGEVILYAHQKLLKIREKILIYSDVNQTNQLGELNADRVIDFSPMQTFTNMNGQPVLKVKRNGGRSIWRADYEIMDAGEHTYFRVREEKAWVKVMDTLFSEIPILGLFAGYLFNPKYNVFDENGTIIGQIVKNPALLESNYVLNIENSNINKAELLPIATMTVITRERQRG